MPEELAAAILTVGGRGALDWNSAARAFAEAIAPCAEKARAAGIALGIEPTSHLYSDVSIAHRLSDTVALAKGDILPVFTPASKLQSFGLADQAINVSLMWQGFAADIRLGKRRMPDFDRAVRLTAVLDAIDDSPDTGRTMILGADRQWHGK